MATPKRRRESLRAPAQQPIYPFDGYIEDIDSDEFAPEDEEDGSLLGWDSPERLRKTPGSPRNTPCAPTKHVPLAVTSAASNLQAASVHNKSNELGAEQWAILASKASHALENPQSRYRSEGLRIEATQGQSSSQSAAFVPVPNHQNEAVVEAINRNSKLVESSSKQTQRLIELAERWLERDERSNNLLMHLLAEFTSLPETP
ncbi:hypothetical protein QQX98_000823 [Neonectria punicea]|uniref:Uncharacterized protein n=1 Tax=Neonectria punicea TaxID=979145 RepID=A0ABR1HSF7_9HYPO